MPTYSVPPAKEVYTKTVEKSIPARVAPSFGYGATAWIVGRRILREPTAWVLVFLVGWGILRILALIPILGGLVWFGAVVFGRGVLLVTIWRARTTSRARGDGSARSLVKVLAKGLGPSLRWATATTTRTTRSLEQ